jgi:polysaccharide biosynthesis protein PslJ
MRNSLRLVGAGDNGILGNVGFLGATVASALLVALLVTVSAPVAAAVCAVIVLFAFVAGDTVRLAVLAVVGVWVTTRAPGVDVSFADLVVAGAGVLALFAGAGRALGPSGRLLFKSFAIYLACLAPTLLVNANLRSSFEWFHRVSLVGGAVLVGAWLVMSGRHHLALRLLLLYTAFVAIVAIGDSLSSGLSPAYPLGYHKNFVGSISTTVLLVLIAAPDEFRLPRRWLVWAGLVIAGGLVASQSRAAMVSFVVGILIWLFRERRRASIWLRRAAIVVTLGIAVFAGISLKNQFAAGDQFSSITYRVQIEHATHRLWEDHPYFGVGLRFFYLPQYAGYSPPNNVVDEVLAEGGVIALGGFVVFVFGALVSLGRLSGGLGAAALMVVSARFVHGLFDIYWGAGTTTLPWLIAGMGIAWSTRPRAPRARAPARRSRRRMVNGQPDRR